MKSALYALSLCVLLIACGGGGGTASSINMAAVAGPWTGSYGGGDNGTVSLTVSETGLLNGAGRSNNNGSTFSLSGSMSNTGVVAASASTGGTFTGTSDGKTANGTWSNGNLSGSWSATKVSTASPYQGVWNFSVAGGDTGTCNNVTVSSSGVFSGVCSSNALHSNYSVTGSVSDSGFVSASSTTGAVLTGQLLATGTLASGTWRNANYGISGTWAGSKIN